MIDSLSSIAAKYGTPCFVYDFDVVRGQIAALRTTFKSRFAISYAVKTNPNPTVLSRMRGCVDALDISSGGELRRALDVGWSPDRLTFTGPAKRDAELALAIQHKIAAVVLESVDEAARLERLCAASGTFQGVMLRIAPLKVPAGFGSRMAGKPTQFGIDEEHIDSAIASVLQMSHLKLIGFHIYSGTQCLDPAAVAENYNLCAALFQRVCTQRGIRPEKLIFGSGLGIPYHERDAAIDLAAVAALASPALARLRADPAFAETQLLLETGRYLVGEAGVYLTSVVSTKHSRGAEIAICDGGMNHHMGACGRLGSLLHQNYRMCSLAAPTEAQPLSYDLYGPLCTSIDILARSVKLPRLNVGDIICVQVSGAYGLTASPVLFISHELPREVLCETVDGVRSAVDVSVEI